MKNLPYAQMIVEKVKKEITKIEPREVNSNLTTEFLAGCDFMKGEILKMLGKIEL